MTFQESVKICLGLKYLFKFGGRASRSEFWWFMLFIFLVNLATGIVFMFLPLRLVASLNLVVSLMLLPANLGVTVRRLHDRGMSGWWLLVPIGCLFLALLFGAQSSPLGNALSLSMCVCYLVILCMPSQKSANRFGPPPDMPGL